MIRCLSLALCGALSCLVVGCSSAGMTFDAKSLALKAAPDNFYVVDEDAQIYRSAQPDEESFPELKRVGIRSVLNLRQGFKDSVKYKEAFDGIREYECGVNAGMMKQADLVRALKIIKEAPRPLLIHCLHGSDRTGTVVAAYRIVFQWWTPEQAVTEMEHPRYGMHKFFYPNLSTLIKRADWAKIRQEVLGSSQTQEKTGK